MSETNFTQPRALAPRKLEQKETLQSLNHWKCVLVNYYRRCQFYSYYLAPNISWTNELNRGFIRAESSGLKREPDMLASDLNGFLSTIASYLPFDYVADKIISESTNMVSVWKIIYEIYDAEISTTLYLDYATMMKYPEETYRNYHNRLVGFVKQHLPTDQVTAEGVSSPPTGERMTIGLLDSITVHWLLSIDKRLVNIIKTEYASQLKTHRLCQLVKTIASNIDELLIRYNSKETISSVSQLALTNQSTRPLATNQDPNTVDMIIHRLERLETRGFNNNNSRRSRTNNSKKSLQYCPHCAFLNKQLGATLDVKHNENDCTKKRFQLVSYNL